MDCSTKVNELPKVQATRKALEARVPEEIKRLKRKREQEEAAERKKERAAQRKEKRRRDLLKKKAEARKPFEKSLTNLEQMESMGWLTMADRLTERAKPQLELIAQRLRFDLGKWPDRKSTRLNSSHVRISYAVFCLKK